MVRKPSAKSRYARANFIGRLADHARVRYARLNDRHITVDELCEEFMGGAPTPPDSRLRSTVI